MTEKSDRRRLRQLREAALNLGMSIADACYYALVALEREKQSEPPTTGR